MRVLIACEFSGNVRRAFRNHGVDAWSCDLQPAEDGDKHHIQDDVFYVLRLKWDMMLAFYPCTYLAGSGLWRNLYTPGRKAKTEAALDDVRKLFAARIHRIALENPVGCIGSRICSPDQIIQPNQFGEDASKKTCLWLKNLPKLKPTNQILPRIVTGSDGRIWHRWANQTDSGQNKLSPGPNRAKERGRTYPGIAVAMADQWGDL